MMKRYSLGAIPAGKSKRITEILDGETYMKFGVTARVAPGNYRHVVVGTEYPATDIAILTFAMACLADEL